jgi:hypothetical protein
MKDSVLDGFLESAAADAEEACQKSDCLRLGPDPTAGSPSHTYQGLLKGIEHYVRGNNGVFVITRRPIPFQIHFPHDYLRSLDPNLQFCVVSTTRDLVHPNVNGGVVCLGGRFRPGSRLRAVLEQFYGIATSRVAAIDHPFDLQAAEFFLDHLDAVRGFRNDPLWRSPLAARISVETLNHPTPETR